MPCEPLQLANLLVKLAESRRTLSKLVDLVRDAAQPSAFCPCSCTGNDLRLYTLQGAGSSIWQQLEAHYAGECCLQAVQAVAKV